MLQINELLEEENEVHFEGLFSAKTWKFIIPSKKYWVNIVLHSITSGLLMISCSKYLLKSTLQQLIGSYVPPEIVMTFSVISILQAFHTLIISTPPETAVFRAHDNLELVPISRPFHIILLTIPYWIFSLNPETQMITFSDQLLYYSILTSYVILCILPILWFLGVLPPFEPFILWMMEQIQVFGFGGTPTATLPRTVLQFFLSSVQLSILVFFYADKNIAVIICGISGYILSLDLFGIPSLFKKQPEAQILKTFKKVSTVKKIVQSRQFHITKECITHVFFFVLNSLVILLNTSVMEPEMLQYFDTNSNTTIALLHSRKPSNYTLNMGWITSALYISFKVSNDVQKVYWLFGLIRSPLYRFCTSNQLIAIVWQHLRALLFNFAVSLWMSYYALQVTNSDFYWSPNEIWWWKCLEILAMIRVFRWIWQNTESALFELTCLHLYFVVLENDYDILKDFSRPIQLLIIGFLRDRLKQVVEKIYLVTSLAVSSIEDRPSRSSYAGCLFQINLLFPPYLLALITISSVFSTPILAGKTLTSLFSFNKNR